MPAFAAALVACTVGVMALRNHLVFAVLWLLASGGFAAFLGMAILWNHRFVRRIVVGPESVALCEAWGPRVKTRTFDRRSIEGWRAGTILPYRPQDPDLVFFGRGAWFVELVRARRRYTVGRRIGRQEAALITRTFAELGIHHVRTDDAALARLAERD